MKRCPECGAAFTRFEALTPRGKAPVPGSIVHCIRCGAFSESNGTELLPLRMRRWNSLCLEDRSTLGMAAIIARRRRHGEVVA